MEIDKILKEEKLKKYMDLVLKYNQSMNLTAIVDEKSFYDKHFYDSLYIDEFIDLKDKKIMDLGSGAGFPGIPLAICHNEATFYLVEPLKKRCNFLNLVKEELGLDNVVVINSRAEDLDKEFKEYFDLIVTRAVSKINILVEICTLYLKINGNLILYKGLKYQEEIDESKNAIGTLKLKVEGVKKGILPFSKETRFYIILSKLDKTPAGYPRAYSRICKKPL